MTHQGEELPGVADLTDRATARGGGERLDALAAELAFDLLGEDTQRWRHTEGVAARAGQATLVLRDHDAAPLRAAAWLHDIGYAPALLDTGFHPLDGARYLTELGWRPLVAALVAQHSGARHVARVRGLDQQLRVYADPRATTGALANALTWADQTTSPTGQTVDLRTRLTDMLARHGPDSPNARAHPRRAPELKRAVAATTDRLLARAANPGPNG